METYPTGIMPCLGKCMDQHMGVWWEETFQTLFNLNGMQQGGMLFPILFIIYTNDLLDDLSNFGVGCYTYVGSPCMLLCAKQII